VGQQELESRSVNVRNRDDIGNKGRSDKVIKLEDVAQSLLKLKKERSLHNKLD
jgi:threonyl-tRNA synthetase